MRGIGSCARDRVKEGISRIEQLVGISKVPPPPLGVAYCLAKPGLALAT